ncbi:hypothetical protein D9M71_830230 [compost metagenome]
MHGVEGDQLALVRSDHQARGASLARWHQGQSVAVLLDLHGQRGHALFLEQAEAADATRDIGLLVDGMGQRRN